MQDQDHPNLLYILSDQHNPAVTGCYGDPIVETPNLDGLAAEGVVLDNVYATAPLCAPSRMSLLTGRHPYENEVWNNKHILSSSIPTSAHSMGAAGYEPALIGKLHERGPDQLLGYVSRSVGDHSAGRPGAPDPDRGPLGPTSRPTRMSLSHSGRGQSAYQLRDEEAAAAAIHHLDLLGIERRAGLSTGPFSLSVGLMLPHPPYIARADDYNRYSGKVPPPRIDPPSTESMHPYYRWWRRYRDIEDVSDAEVERCRTAYWAMVTRLDAIIGSILDALNRNGFGEDTLVIYSSDHGDHLGEHGLWWKHTLYDSAIKVPGILRWPGTLPAASRCSRVVSTLDLTATMLDALGAPRLPGSRGRTLLPLMTSVAASWDDVVYAESCEAEGRVQRMVRRGDWKLIYFHGMRPQLFNLSNDSDEVNDRVDDPTCRDVRDSLTELVLADWDPEWVSTRVRAKREEIELLSAWGRETGVEDRYRWRMSPAMTVLDPPYGPNT